MMTILPFLDDAFLSSHWHREHEDFMNSREEDALVKRLKARESRETRKETSSEAGFTLYDKPDTPFIAAQWLHTLRDKNVTEVSNGKKLLNDLLKLKTTPDDTLKTASSILTGKSVNWIRLSRKKN
jgi:hypothetical protein